MPAVRISGLTKQFAARGSYGLRAARQATLLGEPLAQLGHDVLVLAIYAVLLPLGVLSVAIALRYARQTGTLGHY